MSYAFKKHLVALNRTRVGVHINPRESLFLHRNERTVPFSAKVRASLSKRLARTSIYLYPDLEMFYQKLANWLKLPTDQIFVTEGVSGAVKALIEAFCVPSSEIIFPVPTFALYPVYARMYDVGYRTLGYRRDYTLDVEKILGLVNRKTAILFLPNPNVPIEGTLTLGQLTSIAKYCAPKKVLLVLDEVYFPYGGPTGANLINRFDNVLVMRSFSKAFGLAGVRTGYLLGQQKMIEYVSKTRGGYETNSYSAEAVSFFIDHYHEVTRYIAQVKEGLAYLKEQFDSMNLEYNGGEASNFIFVNLRDEKLTRAIVAQMAKKGIFIRGGWPKPFSQGFSVTAGPKPLMKRFIYVFFRLLNGMQYGN